MIIGLDIGRNGSAVACPLIALPENLKKYLKSPDYPIIPIKPSHKDFDYLLGMKPKGIVMEPTGGWYSQIWAKFGEVYNIPIYWCGHADLKAQRGHFGFPNKYDDNDALCLTASYYDPYFIDEFGRKRFLEHHLIKAIQPIRALVFQYHQIDKLKSTLTAQCKQRLSYEFPELAATKWDECTHGYIMPIAWLAGKRKHRMRDLQYDKSVAKRLGIDLDPYTIEHAKLHHDLELRLIEIEEKLIKTMDNSLFIPYHRALADFQFSIPLHALILYKVFPFEKFLVNGFPYIERYKSKSDAWQKRNISLQCFQAYFGLSRRIEQSGQTEKIKWSGSKLLRSKMYMWIIARISSRKARIKNKLGEQLGAKWDELTRDGIASGKDAGMRVEFLANRALFQRLRDEIVF